MNQLDPNFDWVTARANCNPSAVFEELRAQAKADVARRNGLRDGKELNFNIEFNFESSASAFKISRIGMQEMREYVVFSKTGDGITASYKTEMARPPLPATLTLSNRGECKLYLDGEEYYFWQFRKRALEPVLFSTAMVVGEP